MNVTIKDLPESAARTLRRLASEQGRSLNREMVRVLAEAAEEAYQRQAMAASRPQLERFRKSLRPLSSSVPLIRADRRQR